MKVTFNRQLYVDLFIIFKIEMTCLEVTSSIVLRAFALYIYDLYRIFLAGKSTTNRRHSQASLVWDESEDCGDRCDPEKILILKGPLD